MEEKLNGWVSDKFRKSRYGKSRLVASGMRRSATGRQLKNRESIDSCAKYLLNHSKYLNYNEYLEKGYPIALVLIEGACRYGVKR